MMLIRTEEEIERLKTNLSNMSIIELLLFFKQLNNSDFDGMRFVREEIEKRTIKC